MSNIMSYFRPFPKIKTERLILYKARLDDADDLFTCMGDPRISEFEVWQTHESTSDTVSYINSLLLGYKNGTCTAWVIRRKSDGRAIGMINLHHIAQQSRRAEIGYWIARDCWRKGYGQEAVIAVIDFSFDTMNLNKIIGKCVSENIASECLMRKLGFSLEGLLRSEIYMKGMYKDIKVFSILNEEW